MRMRIVGISNDWIVVQTQTGRRGDWEQVGMSWAEFDAWMWENFTPYFEEYLLKAEPEQSAAEFFYNYGETAAMRRKGDAYVYEN